MEIPDIANLAKGMEVPESKIQFVCGLSNGESLVEGRGKLARIPGEDSPWHKLQNYLKDNNLTINSFNLWVGDRHYNLPSVNPKFKGLVPKAYNCFRKMAYDAMAGGNENAEHYICAEAIYEDYKLQIWIDEQDTNKSWINIVEG